MAQIKFEIAELGTAADSAVGWHDLTPYIALEGLKWSRNDIDAAGSGRDTQDGYMHRHRVAQKARFDATLRPLSQSELNMILTWVQPETFLVKTADPISGLTTVYTVYSNNIPANFKLQIGNEQMWVGVVIPFIQM